MSLADLWKLIRQGPPTQSSGPGQDSGLDNDPEWLNQSQRAENVSRRASLESADTANLKEMHSQYYALAIGSLERSKFAAETIQKASAAIAALYTGVLAYVFSTTDNPLPLRGLIAPVFLGAAVVLSSIYLTYIVPSRRIDPGWDVQRGARERKAYARLNAFVDDVTEIVNRQIGFLGMALAALFVGLAGIALPFVGVPNAFVGDSEPATREVTSWPTLDAAGERLPVELSTELYKQQVSEVAALRASERLPSNAEEPAMYIFALFIGGALVTLAGYKLPLKSKTPARSENRATDSSGIPQS